ISVVCKRERLQGREQRDKVSDDAPRFPSGELRDVRVPLLGHEAAPRAEFGRRVHETELRRGPKDEFLPEGAEMDREEGQVEQELREVVPVAQDRKSTRLNSS